MMSSIPSANLAASDMRALVHGGSNTNSSFTSVTPGTARTARSTSPGSVPATGQLGAVNVMRIATLPSFTRPCAAVDQAEFVDVDGHLRVEDLAQRSDHLIFESHYSVDTGSCP